MNCIMKRTMISLAVLTCIISAGALNAQTKMTKEDWQKQMTSYTVQRDSLKKVLGTLTKDVDSLQAMLAAMDQKIKNVHDETMAMTGASEEHKKEFDQKLSTLEKWADDLARLSNQDLYARKIEVDSLQAGVDELKKSKLSAVKPFYERIQALQQKVDGLRATLAKPEVIASLEKTYVVGTWAKDRDCLWNISKKKDIYDILDIIFRKNPLL